MCGFPSKPDCYQSLDLLPRNSAKRAVISSSAKVINQPPRRPQIILSMHFDRTVVKRCMQPVDIHARCQRFRKPFLQAGPKSPSQVIDRTLEKPSGARRKNHHSGNSRSPAQDVDRCHETASPVRIEDRPAQKRQHAVGVSCPKNVGRPQVTRFERRAKSVRGLPSHAGVYAFEQDLVVR